MSQQQLTMSALEAITFVKSEAAAIWELTAFLMPNIGSLPVIQTVNKGIGRAGSAWQRAGRIEINIAYICSHDCIEQHKNTIAHELAHIIVHRLYPKAKQAHGIEFRYIMGLMGYDGSTYHSMSRKEAKQAVTAINNSLLIDSI